MSGEIWRDVPGFRELQASDRGRLRTMFPEPAADLTPFDRGRYPHVVAMHAGKGHKVVERVHVLVALAFHGPKPDPSLVCRHLDGNPRNNRADNLAWGTRAENHQDAVRHGTANCLRRGGRHPSAKLSDERFAELVSLGRAGGNRAELARRFGISVGHVYGVLRGTARYSPDVVPRIAHLQGRSPTSAEAVPSLAV